MKVLQQVNYYTIKEHEEKYYVYDVRKKLRLTTDSKEEAYHYCFDKYKRVNKILEDIFKKLETEIEGDCCEK